MEEQHSTICHSRRMKNNPPLPPEVTLGHHLNKKNMQTTKSSTSRATISGPPPEIDPPESSFPLSIEPEITSSFVGDFDIVETNVPEVIEPNSIESETTQT